MKKRWFVVFVIYMDSVVRVQRGLRCNVMRWEGSEFGVLGKRLFQCSVHWAPTPGTGTQHKERATNVHLCCCSTQIISLLSHTSL